MQLRYSFRLYPNGPQRAALARAFGCVRVVYNDALRARETARAAGEVFPKTGDLSKLLITEAKKTEERAWLAEVSAVVLQQSLRDLDAAYRKGKRPRMGAPRLKSRKDYRQAARDKAAKFSRRFVRIGRFEPTSQVCSVCGVKDGPKPLHVRIWECEGCGAVLDRDVNAAVDVAKAAGLAVSACRAQVRPGPIPAQRVEAGTPRDGQPTVVGIPGT
ncbi:hypothetical protein DB35_28065 [Streptomyces abyssalis]|uniref:Transposase n=1 Tax=Streptomyces abyssalis TaxID=933944 RepID=A0A1E7JLM2_9ACTN|nr:helix-turn-helix domain-containing protein [Streptomyces abyssalis]OEU87622.1 hypothetical protein DB35_28065 [Streptomyces abyssalis]OEU88551.1 hypothetical protein AN215_16145 [Streptomyces abyssalis]